MKELVTLIKEPVVVLTNDGRCIAGMFHSFDSQFNIILMKSHERVYSREEPVSVIQLGVQIIRGDTVVCVGRLEEALEAQVDFSKLRADPPIKIDNNR